MFALTLMQGPVKILIANVRIGLYGNMISVIYRYAFSIMEFSLLIHLLYVLLLNLICLTALVQQVLFFPFHDERGTLSEVSQDFLGEGGLLVVI